MADTTVDSSYLANPANMVMPRGPYWVDVDTGYIIYVDSDGSLAYTKTSDAGANWDAAVSINGGAINAFACWYDKETPGDTGTLLHFAFLNNTDNAIYYRTLDTSGDSLGTLRTIVSSLPSSAFSASTIGITKTVSGNLVVAYELFSDTGTYRSTDSGVNWDSRSNVFEAANSRDKILLLPAATADNDDAAAIFGDSDANEMSLKMYDETANTWTETSITSTGIALDSNYFSMDAAVRLSDSHILFAMFNDFNSATGDLITYDLNPNSIASPTVTAKTDVVTNQSESGFAAIIIDQQNDDVYVAYIKGGTMLSLTDVVFYKSTDDMTSWGTEQAYSETTDDIRFVHGGRTATSGGGRIQWVFFNDDLDDIFVNLVNDIAIAGGTTTSTSSSTSSTSSSTSSTSSSTSSTSTSTSSTSTSTTTLPPVQVNLVGSGGSAIFYHGVL